MFYRKDKTIRGPFEFIRQNDMAAQPSRQDNSNVKFISEKVEIENLKEQLKSQQVMLQNTTNFLIKAQKELEVKNKTMFDSISFASHIQNGLFPTNEVLKGYFKDSFLHYQQRDMIGGDMPFVRKSGNDLIVAAVDCTGHGVSGAMLTTMAHSYLIEIMAQGVLEPAKMLKLLQKSFSLAFDARTNELFGMDVALVRYNLSWNVMEFAGAGRPLLQMRDGELTKWDKTSLGIGMIPDVNFKTQLIEPKPGDTFYLFSDGVTDQLGDKVPKKFSEKRFRNLVSNVNHLNLEKQKQVILDVLHSWQGKEEQTDDQIMIGFKIK